MGDDVDLDDDPAVEELFYSVIGDVAPAFTANADRLGVSNEDLQRLADRCRKHDVGIGLAVAGLCLEAIQSRRVGELAAMVRPGEGSVAVAELVEREARTRGKA